MKAIHNIKGQNTTRQTTVFNTSKIQNESNSQQHLLQVYHITTVFNTSKIQNESNSQQLVACFIDLFDCVQYVKDTK